MRRKAVFLSASLFLVTLLAPAQIGRRGVHIIGSTNVSYTGQFGSGVSVFGGSGGGGGSSVPANALLHDATGAPLLNDATGAYLLHD